MYIVIFETRRAHTIIYLSFDGNMLSVCLYISIIDTGGNVKPCLHEIKKRLNFTFQIEVEHGSVR